MILTTPEAMFSSSGFGVTVHYSTMQGRNLLPGWYLGAGRIAKTATNPGPRLIEGHLPDSVAYGLRRREGTCGVQGALWEHGYRINFGSRLKISDTSLRNPEH